MMNALRAELIKMRSMPGVWVTFALAFPLSVLVCIGVLASAGGFPGHTFYYVQSLHQRRQLLGAGYFGIHNNGAAPERLPMFPEPGILIL